MSLRQRLLLAVAAALAASLAVGIWITVWQAAQMVRAELAAALATGRGSAVATLQDMPQPPAPDALLRLVSGFDGSRHIQAELLAPGHAPVRSHPAPPPVASPAWFAALATPALDPVEWHLPGALLRLSPLPASEVGERWSEARRLIGLLGLSAGLAALFCFVTALWSLRPLGPLGAALLRLETFRQSGAVAETGPPEIARLAASFNRLQAALTQTAQENRRLSAQLDRLAEEERVELARDLHDEIGPLLFAVTAWASAARMQDGAGDRDGARASLQALEGAAASVQQAVRELLHRLRDSAPAGIDLAPSLEALLDFWRGVRPGTSFSADLAPGLDSLPEAVRAALFRVAQEGISNAIRHGNPGKVHVRAALHATGAELTVQDDGIGGAAAPGPGLGLVGLEERLGALGGMLKISRGAGWRLTGWAPLAAPEAP